MDAFQITEQAQETIAEVYALISRRFADDSDLRALFLMLSEEERRHVQKIRELGTAWREEGDYWQPTSQMDRLLALMEQTEEMLASLFQRPRFTPEQALELAAKLERDFDEVRRALFESEDEPQLRDLFKLLMQHGHGHDELFARLKQGNPASSPAAQRRLATLTGEFPMPVLEGN